MLFSIVVPYYNREAFLERTLSSLHNQNYRPLEIILVDNQSSDASLSICQKFKLENESDDFIIELLSSPQKGAARARNIGLERAKGDYVYFFDSDDSISADFLTDVFQIIKEDPSIDIVACRTKMVFPNGKTKIRRCSFSESIEDQILTGMLSTQSMFFKKDFVKGIGGWNEDLSKWDDWELGVRVLNSHSKLYWIKGKAYHSIYQHADSLTGNSFSERIDDILFAIDTVEKIVCESKSLKNALMARKVILAGYLWKEKNNETALSIYNKVLSQNLKFTNKFLFYLLFQYTRMGGVGSWFIFKYFSFLWRL
jgi:glycosyltransferase involved in cell wall biosynthesis